MKIASQTLNTYTHTHPWPGSVALSGKTQGVSDEGREDEKRGTLTRSRNTESKTADGRQPRVTKGTEKEGGREAGGSAIKRGKYKEPYEGGKGRSLRARRRVKRRETPVKRRWRASARERERNTDFKEDNDLCLR